MLPGVAGEVAQLGLAPRQSQLQAPADLARPHAGPVTLRNDGPMDFIVCNHLH